MKISNLLFLSLAAILLSLSGCDSGMLFEQTKAVTENEWHKDSVFHFESDSIEKSNQPLFFYFMVRTNQAYPYSNIFLFVDLQFPNGEGKQDTLEHDLMLPNGQWASGVEASGTVQTVMIRFPYALKQPPVGRYKASIQQGMRDSLLQGILDVGFKIDKFQP